MNFRNYQLFIDDAEPSISDFNLLRSTGLSHDRHGNDLHEIEMRIVEDRFFMLSSDYDNSELYHDKVWDTDKEIERRNPRPKTQVELRQQFFACYDLFTHRLYISDPQKKAFLKSYIKKNIQKNVNIKNIFSSFDEFVRVFHYLKRIRFVQTRNLANESNDSIFKKQVNIFGFDMPERLLLKLEYGKVDIRGFVETLKQLGMQKQRGEFEEIVVVGEDDSGLEKCFDFSSMISYIEIEAEKDDNGRYKADEILEMLMTELRGRNV